MSEYLKDAAKVTVGYAALAVFSAVMLISSMWLIERISAW